MKKLTKKQKREEALKEIHKILDDPELLRKAEELHKKMSYISFEELHRPFTI
jgi:hypothetical protein